MKKLDEQLQVRMDMIPALVWSIRSDGSVAFVLPFVFVSAHSDDETRRKVLAGGTFARNDEPFDGNDLLTKVDRAVSKVAVADRGGRPKQRKVSSRDFAQLIRISPHLERQWRASAH